MPGQDTSLHRGAHACLLYQTAIEQKAFVLPFVHDGLRNGEQCVYVADEQPVAEWQREFQAFGIDVEAEVSRGSLIICAGELWRQAADFDSIGNARRAWTMMEEAFQRFRGIRFVVDAGWMLEPAVTAEELCHWEATINPLIAGDFEARIVCQYNLTRHSPSVIHSALRTHPVVVLGGRTRSNPYYEAPLILQREPDLNRSDADGPAIARMLSQLRAAG